MNEKPEALRLADECDWSAKFKAAKELRRQHHEIERLKAENERLREALESIAANACCDRCQEAALVARAALRREEAGREHNI